MSQDETMKIVAEVVDKFSGPLKDLRKQLQATGGDAKNKQLERSYEDIRKSVRGLRDEVKGGLTPALAVFGLTAFSVGGAMAAVASSLRTFASSTNSLSLLRRETGLTIDTMRQFESFAARMGSTPEAMRAGFSAFARNAQEFRKGIGSTFTTLWNEGDAGLKNFLLSLREVGDNEELLKRVLKFSDQIPDPIHRQKFLEPWGIPPQLGRAPRAERDKILKDSREDLGTITKEAQESAEKFEYAMFRLQNSWSGLQTALGSSGALDAVRQVMVDLRAFASENREEFGKGITQFFRDVGPVAREFGTVLKGIGQGIHWLQEVSDKLNEIRGESKDVKPWVDIPKFLREGSLDSPALREQLSAGKESTLGFAEKAALDHKQSQLALIENALARRAAAGEDTKDLRSKRDLLAADIAELKRALEKATKEGASEGVQDGIRKMMLEGRPGGDFGGGARVIRASYGGASGGYGGGGVGGGGGGNGMGRGIGGGGGYDETTGAGLGGSDYLKAQRARFGKEMEANPALRKKLAALTTLEGNPANVTESLMNRMAYSHGTLASGMSPKFFGPYRKIPGAAAQLERNPKRMAKINAAIDSVLAGRNVLKGATDQGMRSDPNGRWPGGSVPGLDQVYNDWGGGPGGHEGARRFREEQQRRVAAAQTPTPKTADEEGADRISRYQLPKHGDDLRKHFGAGRRAGTSTGLRADAGLDQNREAERKRLMGDTADDEKRQNERNRLFDSAANSGVLGGPANLDGNAKLQIDLNGFPKGTKTKTEVDGIFSDVKLNRGRSMPLASETE